MTPEQAETIIELIEIEALIAERYASNMEPSQLMRRRDELRDNLRDSARESK